MNIHHLELFYYVARHGGIMEAVRNMPYGIQQPAVSGQIIQLESDLGLKLFQRRPFALTPAGAELYGFIRPFFDGVEPMGEKLRGGASQSLRMAAPTLVLRNHLPEVLQELRTRHPRLKLHLRDAHQPQVEQWLDRQEIDFAVTVLEGHPGTPETRSEPLLRLPIVLLVPKASRVRSASELLESVAAGTGTGDRAESPTEPLITLPGNEALPRRLREWLAGRGLEWPTSIEVSSIDLIEIYVASGFGVGLSVEVPGHRTSPRLRVLPVPEIEPLQIGALWRGNLQPIHQELLVALRIRASAMRPPERTETTE